MTDTTNTLKLVNEYLMQGGYSPGIDADALDAESTLIAAAPDMLAALEWAVETADTEQYEADWYAAARAAIAKAKGADNAD